MWADGVKVWELQGYEHDTDHGWFYGQVSLEANEVCLDLVLQMKVDQEKSLQEIIVESFLFNNYE